ncbi:hypothetical protein GOBAR_AA27498 [Gossypium barbadense]|uniref:Uncharacterized protein n=1 Tax=Gossypium barbadense TaxID=3634 RepID=A0A2P5WQ25_GOSBA|nr:hypothetical protein GOBAR_AA27498 [Gossypium barbadense]
MPQIPTLSLPHQMKKSLLWYSAFSHSVRSRRVIPSSALLRFSTETRPSTRACLGPCENREKISPNTGYDKTPRPCDMAVVEPAKTTRAYDSPVWKNHG